MNKLPLLAHLPTMDDADDFRTDEGLDDWAAKNPTAAVPVALWRGFIKTARVKREHLEARVAQLEERIHERSTLDQRVRALELRPTRMYRGEWKQALPYPPQSVVSFNGTYWINIAPVTVVDHAPGEDNGVWHQVIHVTNLRRDTAQETE